MHKIRKSFTRIFISVKFFFNYYREYYNQNCYYNL